MESMCSTSSNSIGVLIADSNQMQCQLLVSALRRRPEFEVTSCILDPDAISHVIASLPVQVAILNADSPRDGWPDMTVVRQLHLAHPEVAKIILLNAYDRDVVVKAFAPAPAACFASPSIPFGCSASASRACTKDKCGPTVNRCNIWSK